MIRVGWIFSLVRSGSSAASYGAAAPWGLPVADEIFGPWDRTGEPYNMPPKQAELVRAFQAVGHVLTSDVVGLAGEVLEDLAQRDPTGEGRVVCKCPHLMFTPKDFATWFGATEAFEHRAAYLIRNPVRRVNSCYARGWESFLNDPFELDVYRTFMRRWQGAMARLRFEDMRENPEDFFRDLYTGWGWAHDDDDLSRAAGYVRTKYHDASGDVRESSEAPVPVSETTWATPAAVLDAYLYDDEVCTFMHEQGWPTSRRAYAGGVLKRARRAMRSVSR